MLDQYLFVFVNMIYEICLFDQYLFVFVNTKADFSNTFQLCSFVGDKSQRFEKKYISTSTSKYFIWWDCKNKMNKIALFLSTNMQKTCTQKVVSSYLNKQQYIKKDQ